MPLPLLAIGLGLSALGAGGKFLSGLKQNKMANKIKPHWQQYQTSPFAKQQLATAQQAANGRMAGAGAMERNIMANQAGQIANINRNATDSSQALALAAGTQAQSNNAYGNLAINEAQNKYSMLGNLNRAYGQMINEGDKVHQSIMDKYQMDVQQKNALRNAGKQNMFGAVGDLSSMAMMGGQMGLFGGNGGAAAGGGEYQGLTTPRNTGPYIQ